MNTASSLLEDGPSVLVVFSVFVSCALLLAIGGVTGKTTTEDFYSAERRLSPVRNGLALFGDYVSAATLLGTTGLIALTGYAGVPYLIGPALAWIVIVFLIAEPYHSTGRFTIGDCLASRLQPRPVHLAAGIATLVVCMLFLIAQLVGVGALAAPILGLSGPGARQAMVVSLGVLMILYVVVGGMRATTLVQLAKAVFLFGGGLWVALTALAEFHWNPAELLASAAQHSGVGNAFLQPAVSSGRGIVSALDSLSLQLAIVTGTAVLPHILMRLRAVPTAGQARRSAQWATVLAFLFVMIVAVLGLAAAALLGPQTISAHAASGNGAVLLLAEFLGGSLLLTLVSVIAFATILAIVAGATLAAAASLAHDIYAVVITHGTASEEREVFVARLSAVLIGLSATVLSMYAQSFNVSLLAGVASSIAASSILPALLYRFYWRRFTTRGATWSIYGGLLLSLLLVTMSPGVSGSPEALLPQLDFAVFPMRNPGLLAIPFGFFLGWMGTVLDSGKYGLPKHSAGHHSTRPERL